MLARVRFSGVFILYRDSDGVWVLFPNSRRADRPLHSPRLNFREVDRLPETPIGRIAHRVVSDARGDAVLSVDLQAEEQLDLQSARLVRFLADGKEPEKEVTCKASCSRLYDLAKSGIEALHDPKGPWYAASIPLKGGELKARRRVAGAWELGDEKLGVLLDGLEWSFRFEKSVRVVLESSKQRATKISLAPSKGRKVLWVSVTAFSDWYEMHDIPSYRILEQAVRDSSSEVCGEGGRSLAATFGCKLPWPKPSGEANPSVYCPSGGFKIRKHG